MIDREEKFNEVLAWLMMTGEYRPQDMAKKAQGIVDDPKKYSEFLNEKS